MNLKTKILLALQRRSQSIMQPLYAEQEAIRSQVTNLSQQSEKQLAIQYQLQKDVAAITALDEFRRARTFAESYTADAAPPLAPGRNPLSDFFESRNKGRGIWKWRHYFDIYHRYLAKFVGTNVKVMEIGVYSGGSLDMWLQYFGSKCHLYGLDIEEACRAYANDRIEILIGDQADVQFWTKVKGQIPMLDVIIDDGGHTVEQQIVTLEQSLPHLKPGGIFICEDVHGVSNAFNLYIAGLISEINQYRHLPSDVQRSEVSAFQKSIYSIHCYPYMVVIEKNAGSREELFGPRKGTEWQPFL